MASRDRPGYQKEYYHKNKNADPNDISTRGMRGARESHDVWNVRRSGKCFAYPELYISFLTQTFRH